MESNDVPGRKGPNRRAFVSASAATAVVATIVAQTGTAHAAVPGALEPTGDTNGIKDLINIQAAINTNESVILDIGVFYINAPIVLNVSGQRLHGSGGACASGNDSGQQLGTTIVVVNPTAHPWSDPNPWAGQHSAAIAIVQKNAGQGGGTGSGKGLATSGIRVTDLWLDLTSAPASVDGIMCLGSVGAVQYERVGVRQATGRYFPMYLDTSYASANYPDGQHLYSCMANGAATSNGLPSSSATGQDGFYGAYADAVLVDCHAQQLSSLSDGFWFNSAGANNRLIGCRGDLCQNGFTFDAQSTGGFYDSHTLIGCGTQGNQNAGLNVVNSSSSGITQRAAVIADGCTFDQDGNFGIQASGRNLVILSNTVVRTGSKFTFGGPATGISMAAQGSSNGVPSVVWNGGLLNALDGGTLVNGAANTTVLSINVLAAPGIGATDDTYMPLQIQTPALPAEFTTVTFGRSASLQAIASTDAIGYPDFTDKSGLTMNMSGSRLAQVGGTTITSTVLTSLGSQTIPPNGIEKGSSFSGHASGSYSTGATAPSGATFSLYWGGTGGTQIASLAIPTTIIPNITNGGWFYDFEANWISTTEVTVTIKIGWHTGANVSTSVVYFRVVDTTGLSTTVSQDLTMAFQWGSIPPGTQTQLVSGLIRIGRLA